MPSEMKPKSIIMWGLAWYSKNKLDGVITRIICESNCNPRLFNTRKEARMFAEERMGYLRNRPDLKAEPYGWRMPRVVRLETRVINRRSSHEQ